MAADLIARGLAAKALVQAGAGSGAAAKLACEPVSKHYLAGDGANMQPAFQRAVDAAIAEGGCGRVVNDYGPVQMALWEKEIADTTANNGPFFATYNLISIPACNGVEIDFAGARLTRKGYDGGPAGQPWSGGSPWGTDTYFHSFINTSGPITGTLVIRNVDFDGGFTGDAVGQADVNLLDKGFRFQDTTIARTISDNVTLHGFAGEIMYDNSSALHISRDCHFYNSGHSCWNPGGTGKLVAYNLQAGIARQAAEVVGGKGHTYYGGRFYKCSSSTFIGGPDPGFDGPYNVPHRRTDAPPPLVQFIGTRFEEMSEALYLGSYMQGSIRCLDAPVIIAPSYASAGAIRDIDLDVVSLVDRTQSNITAVWVAGNASEGDHQPRNIHVRLHCGRTRLAEDNNRKIQIGLVVSGRHDPDSCAYSVDGRAEQPYVLDPSLTGAQVPLVTATHPATSSEPLFISTNHTLAVAHRTYTLYPDVGTFAFALSAGATFTPGQRVRFVHGANDADKIVTFAPTGAGMKLNALRSLRRTGEYLELEWSIYGNTWVEAGFLGDQPKDLLAIDSAIGLPAFSAAPWGTSSMTLASAGVAGPYGTGDATRLASTGLFNRLLRPSSGRRTLRMKMKAGSGNQVALFMDTAPGQSLAIFDLSSGTQGFTSGNVTGGSRSLGGGWYQLEITGTCTGNLGVFLVGGDPATVLLFDATLLDGSL